MALDTQTIKELKDRLLSEKERLEKELSRFAKVTDAPGDYETKINDMGTDPDENASEVEEYVDNLALENTLENQLRDVTDALSRMENGTYGKDENTGEEISVDRLRAYPQARVAL